MSKPYVANRDARRSVQDLKVFKGSNTWGEWYETNYVGSNEIIANYVVYSFRYTWPLFVFDNLAQVWYENVDAFSQTTKKHKTQLHPLCNTIPLNVEDMRIVVREGGVGLISKEMV
jgi:hypothetical protein